MPNRPQPRFPEPHTEPYWKGAQNGQLRYQTCAECAAVVFSPRLHCTSCGSADLHWHSSRGVGTVYTYTVIRKSRMRGFAAMGSYVVALVDLDEGFRMLTNVVTGDPSDVVIGMRVSVEFEKQDEGEYPVPVFRPVAVEARAAVGSDARSEVRHG